MILAFMLRATCATVLIAIAATLTDALLRLFGRPRRGLWAVALWAAFALPVCGTCWPRAFALMSPWARAAAWAGGHPVGHLPASAGAGHPWAVAAAGRDVAAIAHAVGIDALGSARANAFGVIAWIVMSACALTMIVFVDARLSRARRGWVAGDVDGTRVLIAPSAGPAVVGVLRPVIVLPAWVLDAAPLTCALVLDHEREHLRSGDSRLLFAAVLAAALMPWNIGVWWLLQSLRASMEADCDRRVLVRGVDVREYAEAILAVAGAAAPFDHFAAFDAAPAALGGRPIRHLERRILDMTTDRSPLKFRATRALALAGAAAVVLLAACETAAPGVPTTAPRNPASPSAHLAAAANTDSTHVTFTVRSGDSLQDSDVLKAAVQAALTRALSGTVLAGKLSDTSAAGPNGRAGARAGQTFTLKVPRGSAGTLTVRGRQYRLTFIGGAVTLQPHSEETSGNK